MKAKPIMIQGTASGVGKTMLTIALCRIFMQDGYKTAPFKSQNMTSNTALTENGEEIAISQMLQAHAAGACPDANMNPIILKLSSEGQGMQVVLNGRPYDTMNAHHFKETKEKLIPQIMKAYDELSEQYDIIVIEGAGNPVELNLNKDDIVNMGVAKRVNAPVLLVSDIDRGGVFASLYGTIGLLNESEREYVKATVINRFRGELSHFSDGVKTLETITGLPVAGVIPHISFDLPEEDSVRSHYAPCDDFDSQFDLIANHVRSSLNMDLIYTILNNGVCR